MDETLAPLTEYGFSGLIVVMPNIVRRTIRVGFILIVGIIASAIFLFPPQFFSVNSSDVPAFSQNEYP